MIHRDSWKTNSIFEYKNVRVNDHSRHLENSQNNNWW